MGRWVSAAIGVAVLAGATWALHREVAAVKLAETARTLGDLSPSRVAAATAAILAGLVAYRAIHYVFPLLGATLLLGAREGLRVLRAAEARRGGER